MGWKIGLIVVFIILTLIITVYFVLIHQKTNKTSTDDQQKDQNDQKAPNQKQHHPHSQPKPKLPPEDNCLCIMLADDEAHINHKFPKDCSTCYIGIISLIEKIPDPKSHASLPMVMLFGPTDFDVQGWNTMHALGGDEKLAVNSPFLYNVSMDSLPQSIDSIKKFYETKIQKPVRIVHVPTREDVVALNSKQQQHDAQLDNREEISQNIGSKKQKHVRFKLE